MEKKEINSMKFGRFEFNVDAVKKMSKKQFIKQHSIFETDPRFKGQIDLSEVYDKIRGKE